MTKIDLVRAITESTGFPAKISVELVDDVLEVLRNTLGRGEDVKLSGFGNFQLREKNARHGRKRPFPKAPPKEVWINPPKPEESTTMASSGGNVY